MQIYETFDYKTFGKGVKVLGVSTNWDSVNDHFEAMREKLKMYVPQI